MASPRGERLSIVLAGRRNVGKSSLINALAGQSVAIVSEIPGTTTDPVRKSYELLPLGPVTFIDTAGIDDQGEIGSLRVARTEKTLKNADLVLIVAEADRWEEEEELRRKLKQEGISYLIVMNKSDLGVPSMETAEKIGEKFVSVSSVSDTGIDELKLKIIETAGRVREKSILRDLVEAGETVVLVVPIDLSAPRGRLILPQVQVIRDILDNDAIVIVTKERDLHKCLSGLNSKPSLVVTDSQAVLKVVKELPADVRLTTFSILFARYKGELGPLIRGARIIDELKDGDRVMIAEACSHHVQEDDIGRVKIPRWLTEYSGVSLKFETVSGLEFPPDISGFKLIIHCGGCMITEHEMKNRIKTAQEAHVAITNYGICISKVQGVLERTAGIFSEFQLS
ncbi:MAG: [FeFe] hydrogenase H-cluster maturation GTPase HydF [Candidatus Wallbacteria bacterium]|nr:[FeFe] hydrogenase H-cluster maturation GTPase HydF [Candidatus Wallbacteria bacterium]